MLDFRQADRPRLFGHRGCPEQEPENTVASFRKAIELGADHLELDVHLSSDGQVVVIHDESVERTRQGHGRVRALSWAELQLLPPRDRPLTTETQIPLLSTVLLSLPDVLLNIELKGTHDSIVSPVLAVLAAHHALPRVLLAAEDDSVMQRIRAEAPSATTGTSAAEVMRFLNEPQFCPPGFALQVPRQFGTVTIVTPEFVARAHGYGREVHVWTVNDPDEIRQLCAMGVDGIITDRPGMARQVLSELNTVLDAPLNSPVNQ